MLTRLAGCTLSLRPPRHRQFARRVLLNPLCPRAFRHLSSASIMAESAAPIAKGGHWHWQQTMLRIKDPKASVAHYTENYGMTLIAHLQFPQWTFDLYFLTTLPEGTEYTLDPKSKEAEAYCFQGDYGGHENVALELTHNYGTEELEGPVYHGGNAMECPEIGENGRDGFGHIAVRATPCARAHSHSADGLQRSYTTCAYPICLATDAAT
jgi:lactoylglutathione lyase